jgi:hypothetical protein
MLERERRSEELDHIVDIAGGSFCVRDCQQMFRLRVSAQLRLHWKMSENFITTIMPRIPRLNALLKRK